jgi:hypothetical protein
MNQAADIIFSKLGCCPAFLVSQEPIDADTKLKVVKVLQWIIIRRTSLVLDIFQNQTIHQYQLLQPTISTYLCSSHCGNHCGNLFSSGYCANMAAFLFFPFFMRILNVGL